MVGSIEALRVFCLMLVDIFRIEAGVSMALLGRWSMNLIYYYLRAVELDALTLGKVVQAYSYNWPSVVTTSQFGSNLTSGD